MSNNQMNTQITTADLMEAYKVGHAIGRTVYVAGPAGVGKSDITRDFADHLLNKALEKETNADNVQYLESIRGKNCIDIRLSLETPDTLKGIVIPKKQEDGSYQTTYAYNERYPTDPRWVGVIFFDELSSAPSSLQTIAYQALLDKCIGELPFPEGAAVIAAGNRVGDGGVAYELLKPVQNRIIQVELKPDLDSWMNGFALKAGVDGSILAFLKAQPNLLHNGNSDADCPAFASPRSWTAVDAIVKRMKEGLNERLAFTMIEGSIGSEATSAFKIHYEFGGNLPSSAAILRGEKPNMEIKDAGANYYVAISCLSLWTNSFMDKSVTDEELMAQANNMLNYMLLEMKNETELQGSFAIQLHHWAVQQGLPEGRKVAMMLPKSQAFVDMVKDVNELKRRVAEAQAAQV